MREQSAALAQGDKAVLRVTLVAKSNLTKIAPILLAVAVALLVSSRLAEAATGTVDIRLAKVGAFVGLGRARGTLHFQGHNYPLNISGITNLSASRREVRCRQPERYL